MRPPSSPILFPTRRSIVSRALVLEGFLAAIATFMMSFVPVSWLLGLLLTGTPAHAQVCDPTPYAHILRFSTVVEESHCSGTAIGPYALLTASHCEAASDLVLVDDTVYKIVGKIDRDDFDHSILYLAMAKPFDHYATFRDGAPRLGESASMLGNPGALTSLFRAGTYSGKMVDEDKNPNWMFSFPSAEGDSGSGIFDSGCKLLAVMSFIVNAGDKIAPLWVSEAYPFKFTKEQMSLAVNFKPDPKDIPKPKKLVPILVIHHAVDE